MCKSLVLSIALLSLYVHTGEALKCYVCNSATDPKCGDPIDTSLAPTECVPDVFSKGASVLKDAVDSFTSLLGKAGVDTDMKLPNVDAAFTCVKAVKQDGDKKLVVRTCSVPTTEQFDVCKQMKAQGAQGSVVTFCESCNSDSCNTASGITPSSLLLVLIVSLVAYFARQ